MSEKLYNGYDGPAGLYKLEDIDLIDFLYKLHTVAGDYINEAPISIKPYPQKAMGVKWGSSPVGPLHVARAIFVQYVCIKLLTPI